MIFMVKSNLNHISNLKIQFLQNAKQAAKTVPE